MAAFWLVRSIIIGLYNLLVPHQASDGGLELMGPQEFNELGEDM